LLQEDYEKVLVEENFVDDCRKEWPNFIKARKVHEAYQELVAAGFRRTAALDELAGQFGIKRGAAERFIKVMNCIEEFQDFHSEADVEAGRNAKDEYDITMRAQKYFEYFDELQKSAVQRTLQVDPELRAKVFERLYDGDFVSFAQIRKIPAISADRYARDKFMLGNGHQAVQDAIDWITVTGMARKAVNNNERVISFKRFVDNLSAKEISELDPLAVTGLEGILTKVVEMARVVHSNRAS